MSILAGIVHWTSEASPSDSVRAMLGFPTWAPDGTAIGRARGVSLGVGRVVTTAQQGQPDQMAGASDILAVVDARFDDIDKLKCDLESEEPFSDNDLVIAAYRRWGADMVSRLRGDFAFVLWDARRSTLVAGRDPFGVRPLYFASGLGRLMLASDPEQILATGWVRPAPDDHSVVGHLLWEFPDAERTFFRDIRRLPAGRILVATSNALRISDYRKVSLPDARLGRAEHYQEFRRRFFVALRRRLEPNRPTVVQLSGGLDSSSIVCATDRIMAAEPEAYAGVFAAAAIHPGLASNEEAFIDAVAEQVTLPVERWDGTAALADELEQVQIWAPGGRFPWTGGTRGDFDLADRSGARVILNGTGGDQLGLPFGTLQDSLVEGRWRDTGRFLFGAPGATWRSSARRVARLVKSLGPRWARDAHNAVRRKRERRPDWLAPHAWSQWRPEPTFQAVPTGLRSHLQRERWLDLTSGRHAFSLEWVQQYAIRNGMEVRFPFMDWDLVVSALSIPSRYWPPPWSFERLHRQALEDLLPPAIVRRRSKANAADALANRVRRQIPLIREIFGVGSWHAEPYVQRATAATVLGRFEGASKPPFWSTWAVWSIASLEAWLRALSRYTATPRREA